jgi:hypothetical protein
LSSNCLLKHVTAKKVEESMEITERQGRRHKKLLDDLMDKDTVN